MRMQCEQLMQLLALLPVVNERGAPSLGVELCTMFWARTVDRSSADPLHGGWTSVIQQLAPQQQVKRSHYLSRTGEGLPCCAAQLLCASLCQRLRRFAALASADLQCLSRHVIDELPACLSKTLFPQYLS